MHQKSKTLLSLLVWLFGLGLVAQMQAQTPLLVKHQQGSQTQGSQTQGSQTQGSQTQGSQQRASQPQPQSNQPNGEQTPYAVVPDPEDAAVVMPEFSGELAFAELQAICDIGPRISATEGMRRQQEYISGKMTPLGGQIGYQRFNVVHPETRQQVELQNMFVRFHPDRTKRLVLCCHYDTRPFPDRDTVNPRGVFLGANDGASGVALLLELAKMMPHLEGEWGIDMIFFDGEEFVYNGRRDTMFLGSTFFSQEYAAGRVNGVYSYGILVDMIGDKNLEIYYEQNSLNAAPRLVRSIWAVANQMGRTEFIAKKRHKIKDDHLPMNSIARIPTVDIIDFDYPTPQNQNAYWHTQQDIPENCSANSLEAVGSVLREWLIQLERSH